MQKIKYIIIFTLILALAIITLQLTDYQNITSDLLKENNTINQATRGLHDKITLLEEKNQELTDKIISLEEQLAIKKIELYNQNFSLDNNTTQYIQQEIPLLENETVKSYDGVELTPNMSLDNENQITGFGLDYKQKF
jgi:predicted nuclease with TOPRIM domain